MEPGRALLGVAEAVLAHGEGVAVARDRRVLARLALLQISRIVGINQNTAKKFSYLSVSSALADLVVVVHHDLLLAQNLIGGRASVGSAAN